MGLRTVIREAFFRIDDLIKIRNGAEVIHYLHIGKTGGSAIKNAIHGENERERIVIDNIIFYLHGHPITMQQIPKGEKVLFFLRDPTKRFISAFYERFTKEKHPSFPWSQDEHEAFNNFKTPNELACALSSNKDITRRQAEAAMNTIEHIRSPLISWVKSTSYLQERRNDVIMIGLQEMLNEDFLSLKNMLKLPDHIQLPSRGDIKSNTMPKGLDTNLSPTAESNLRQWYAKDYELVQIAKEWRKNNKLKH